MRLPIVKQDGTEYRDASELSTLLASAGDDLYLLAGQAWHGGIHISEDGAPWAKDIHPVRCVADGEVVAYRMMPDYLTSDFKGETYRYSNSFCLVRHNFEHPGTDGEQQGFSYYSLYMHLCPWNAWPSAKRYRLKKRWNVRNSVPHHGDPLPAVTLPAGEIFEPVAGEALQQGKIDGVSYDFMRIRVLSDGVSNSQVDATKGNDALWIAQDASALEEVSIARPAWVYGEVDAVLKTDMHGRADPKTQKGTTGFAIAGDPAHLVPEGTQIQFDAHHVRLQEIDGKARKMARCIIKPSGRAQWICVEEQYLEVVEQKPTQLGKLYELPSPVSIKAGDVIGYLGLYEGPASLEGGTTGNAMIHLEVFSTDEGVKSIVESEKWQEDGFRLVDGSDCDGFLDPESVPAFFQSLCVSDDGTLDADTVISKLTSQTAADERHKIVARHNSEWWTPTSEAMMARFKEIYTSPESHALIDHELERVRQLGWMDKTQRLGFDGPDVWHFYPLTLRLLEQRQNHPLQLYENRVIELEFLSINDGQSITTEDYEKAASLLGCEKAAIEAIAMAETSATGSFYTSSEGHKIPAILFERHYFSRFTSGKFDSSYPDISDPQRGGYGLYREQYIKLVRAYELSSNAALKSASWGKFQIMGSNFAAAGFSDVESFVEAISQSEKNHLLALVHFIKSNPSMHRALKDKNWLEFAKQYNGPKQRGYDHKMRLNYETLKEL